MKRVLTLICLLLFTGVISCKKEIVKATKTEKKQLDLKPEIEFLFPDSTYINSETVGVINYKGKELDSLGIDYYSDLDKDGKVRLIYFQSTYSKSFDKALSFKGKNIDTFVASSNNKIRIKGIRFNQLGLNYLDGLLTDEVHLKLEDGNTRIITKEYRITKEVIVVDSTVVIGAQKKLPVKGNI